MVLPRTEVVVIGRSRFGCLYRQEYFLVYIKFLIVWVAGLVTSSQWFPKFDKFFFMMKCDGCVQLRVVA